MEDVLVVLLVGGGILLLTFLSDVAQHARRSITTSSASAPTAPTATEAGASSQGTDAAFADPKDMPYYLAQRGWKQVSDKPERYIGQYQTGGKSMDGGLQRTASGRRKFYVHDPPRTFVRRARRGRCLADRPHLADNVYEVHFDAAPDSFGDGIDHIEAMLEGAS
ncbi:hypothetical protein [Natrinema sp. 1APR25-10V2]|uniref:hypothetical protein n=1 Tax=Natrinema sp. 1APR25-10V2 TaxID=2951081 RepID=UPI00287653C0|nr:hypothetical protein [Natrinema sp. 1APR25-10V2]MDS0476809.1 hypothetical protein [Natrinema sp. 1APR25-10V2]